MRPVVASAFVLLTVSVSLAGSDWSRFRGPNGSGIAEAGPLPTEFSAEQNLAWRTPLPQGHSSPILWEDRIYLTGFDDESLVTFSLDRQSGEVLWRRDLPRTDPKKVDPRNNAASPSPAINASHVVVFFPEMGVLAYDHAGELKWTVPLGPFNNIYGMGASPILVGNKVILVCDQNLDSYILALDLETGREVWRKPRPEAKSGHSTPVLWTNSKGEEQILVPGSFQLTAYSPETGERIWWSGGLSFEMKSTPVIQDGVLFINGYASPLQQPGQQIPVQEYEEAVKRDANGDGHLSKEEIENPRLRGWVGFVDLDGSGALDRDEWGYFRAAMATTNGMLAIRLGGKGDMTDSALIWQYHRAVPQLPSPLLYGGVLYMVNDGGIVTAFNPSTGEVLDRGRLKGAVDKYYASPVGSDGKVFMVSETGKVAVLKPGTTLDVVRVNDLQENAYATPAIADGRLYIRTESALYAFGH